MSIKTDREFIEELKVTIVKLEFELIPLKQQFEDWAKQNREWAALAASRLELLRRFESEFSAVCMFCDGRLKDMGLGFEVTGHADECKLAEELGDD